MRLACSFLAPLVVLIPALLGAQTPAPSSSIPAESYRAQTIGVLLTGANHDGADGMAFIKSLGGCAIVQDPATAESPVMPSAAVASGPIDHIVDLPRIAPLLIELCPSMPR